MKKTTKKLIQCQINGRWKTVSTETDEEKIVFELACDMAAKVVRHATYIEKMTGINNKDGTWTYIFKYSNGTRAVYITNVA